MQVGLTTEEEVELQGITLEQLLASFKAAAFTFSSGSSAYRGVYFVKAKGKYRASVGVPGKRIQVGNFDDEVEAARAYDQAALHHHGR